MDRQQAWELVCQYTASDSLRKHMLAVEAAMRAYARQFGEDEETWGIVGLLHDFDYERWPNPPDHPLQGAAILAERGYPDDVIYAIKSHADYLTDCPRVSPLDKTLYACDELAGLHHGRGHGAARGHSRHAGQQREEEAQAEELRRRRQPRRHRPRRRRPGRRAGRAHPVRDRRHGPACRRALDLELT